jgi:hypothetical protein
VLRFGEKSASEDDRLEAELQVLIYNASDSKEACMPMDAAQVLDAYFLETRAKLLEIAANLDRMDRAADGSSVKGDPRNMFVREALGILLMDVPNRTERIQRLYSKG